jgi:two-component system chemotaxis response regulator CheB
MGGIKALKQVLSQLPASFPAPIVVVQHRSPNPPYLLPEVLRPSTKLKVMHAHAGERLQRGTVYVASPELHLVVHPDHTLGYVDGQKIRHLRSSANPLFLSASKVFGRGVIAVVLSGLDSDATDGVQSVSQAGGVVIAQHPLTCEQAAMPRSAIATGCADFVIPLDKIADTLVQLTEKSA